MDFCIYNFISVFTYGTTTTSGSLSPSRDATTSLGSLTTSWTLST